MDSTSLKLKKSYNDIINSTTVYYNDYSLFNITYNEELHDFIIRLFNDEIVIREENINPRYYYIVGIYYFSVSYNLNEAIKWFQLAYDKMNDIKYLNYLIFAYYEKRDYEKAVELLLPIVTKKCSILSIIVFIRCATELFIKKNDNNIYKNMLNVLAVATNNILNKQITSLIKTKAIKDIFFELRMINYHIYNNQVLLDFYCEFLTANKKKHIIFQDMLTIHHTKNEMLLAIYT
jgi:hypothetical protein